MINDITNCKILKSDSQERLESIELVSPVMHIFLLAYLAFAAYIAYAVGHIVIKHTM